MKPILRHARANLIAYLALFVALGGTSYAAINLPANSVGTRQLKNNSITPIKFNRGSVGAYVRAWAVIQNGNRVVASRPRARVVSWDPSFGAGVVSWGKAVSKSCFPLASGGRDFVQVALLPGPHGIEQLHFGSYSANGQTDSAPVLLSAAIFCPER